jgi:hypothetical protein
MYHSELLQVKDLIILLAGLKDNNNNTILFIASSTMPASVAELAAQRKETKCAEISKTHLFFPLVFETMGPINRAGQEFISELGHLISASTVSMIGSFL